MKRCISGYAYNERLDRCVKKKYQITVANAWAGRVVGQYPDWEWKPEEFTDKKKAIQTANKVPEQWVMVWEVLGDSQKEKKVVWRKRCPTNKVIHGDLDIGACVDKDDLERWQKLKKTLKQRKLTQKEWKEFKRIDFYIGGIEAGNAVREISNENNNLFNRKYMIDSKKEMVW